MRNKILSTAAALVLVGAAACDNTGLAYGDANVIIFVSTPALWDEVREDVETALQPTIRTVRDERKFTVTYQDPQGEYWGDLRRFRQVLMVGTAEDSWMIEAMEKADEEITTPGIHHVSDVWARDQSVVLVLLPAGGGADEVRGHLPALIDDYDERYQNYVIRRMYLSSGIDSTLADTLYLEAGFSILLPNVYRWEQQDSVFIFRNDQPDPSELIRQISVTWASPVPVGMQPEGILEWRQGIADAHYSEPQAQVLDDAVANPFEFRGEYAYEIRAAWRNPPDRGWPAGGPFITRAILCENQGRMYLLDAWLYAPGKKKYEYMIQLETIMDTFRCGVA